MTEQILVFVDRLSRMVHFAATHTTATAEDTARLFRHKVFRLHGMPREIISDRDTRFTSRFCTEVCRLLNIRQGLSTAYHPPNGWTDRKNKSYIGGHASALCQSHVE
jgi:transposase InsO family protein